MKNQALWILLPSMVLLSIFLWMRFQPSQGTSKNNFRVDYIEHPSGNTFSLSVFDSDISGNMVIMEQLVGTLVKYSGTARYEPYLAKSWSVSEDQKTWTFELHQNLVTEDGEQIDAQNYAINLKKLLRIYNQSNPPSTFNRLIGWENFIKGDDSAIAIKAKSKFQLEFSFSITPSGVLEFLSMPYYGYYSKANFDGDKWRDKGKIFSSALYKLSSYSASEVSLEPRKNWPTFRPEMPNQIVYRKVPYKDVLHEKRNFIIELTANSQFNSDEFIKFTSPPTLLRSLVVSPFIYPFDSIQVRKAFRTFIRKKSQDFNFQDDVSRKTDYFYSVFSSYPLEEGGYQESLKLLKALNLKTLTFFNNKYIDNEENKYIEFLISSIRTDLGWNLQIETPETVGSDYIAKRSSNKNFALRIARVDIGGSPENWIIDMMFCSKLGISFPDHDGSICNLVKKYEKGEYLNKLHYWSDLHNAIESQATVVPIISAGFSYIISNSIDTSNMTPTMSVPRFDQLRRKE